MAGKEGAKILCGGKIPESPVPAQGFYFEPTILADVTSAMRTARDEVFGPVLSVLRFSSEKEALEIANDSPYGLAAMVWSKDLDKARRAAQALECGTVWINTYGGFYNEAPFGGYKQSGFGRELGRDGLMEYMQSKHICTDTTPGGRSLVSSWF
jgi:acyl-CoA reductase-like NAD-dependent aldehyde dehydrogenase